MRLARVVGTVESAMKHPAYDGQKNHGVRRPLV